MEPIRIVCIAGPTASGKSARAVERALQDAGEIISVDSRQVYRTLDIGTEKVTRDEMRGVPHHLIDVRDPSDTYSAGDFVEDATKYIEDIHARGKLPILAGGTHFYFDALLHGLPPQTPPDPAFREGLEAYSSSELYERIHELDPARAAMLDPMNRRRLIRALEILNVYKSVPERIPNARYEVEWIRIEPERVELRARIDTRLKNAFARGLIDEVERVRKDVGDERLEELGLEYRIVGEYLRGEREESTLMPALSAKLWQYAKRQMMWLRKLASA
ncbi:MAG TPA: tRNA (adenosine(37)-N6)-dimethylallyltransferase MiaA [Candidatus Paceibacterota bacterium]|nr:tRNA (adenosine(37)-N6)-dimethylallyltransferase MiaA [Candidatus Paceibacterota bacterium]